MSAQKQEPLHFAVIATDVALFRIGEEGLEVLLIPVSNPHYAGKKGLPGGLIGPKETADDSVYRHLSQKGGITDAFFEQLYTFSAIDRDKRDRVVSVAYLGLIESSKSKLKNESAAWVLAQGVGKLAYDHNEILKVALERLRGKLAYTNIVRHLLPNEFTLPELQTTYETILAHPLDKRNFRKKILALGLVEKTDKERRGEANRPAAIYRWSTKKDVVIEIL